MREFRIVERGNGPTIEGTRVTVYRVYDYYQDGIPSLLIAGKLRLSTPQVDAAIAYIDSHRAEVEAEYAKILERCRRGNPPEIRALLRGSLANFEERMRQRRQERPA
jgi:uncharacterized protein (DUF433 family)